MKAELAEMQTTAGNGRPILEVNSLVEYFDVLERGILRKKKIGDVHAVDNVSFHISVGETLGLVGESGCGKTTAGKVILYLEKPTSGSVLFEGVDVVGTFEKGNQTDQKLLRRKMQMVFQNPLQLPRPSYDCI